MIIDHIGVVVKSIEKGIEHWRDVFGYKQLTEIVTNTRQKVRVVFLAKENSLAVKLTEPTEESSPIYSFAHRGGGLHHLCFKCENVNLQLEHLQKLGLRILAPPQPGEAFENENIAFVFSRQGLNIELIDSNKRANYLKNV
jgi:methylmalonyl-CoA/ethylmalonyl-CoA epimerase